MIIDDVNKKMKENNYILSTEQLTDIGISKTTLTNYVRDGLLERCGHGFYTVPDSIEDDMYLLMLRSKHIIFSHETALFLNGLSERTPFIHAVTIPSTAAIPSTIKEQCKCYYVKPELHKMGLIENTIYNKITVPMLVLYPGEAQGFAKRFLNFYKLDGNYRSKNF